MRTSSRMPSPNLPPRHPRPIPIPSPRSRVPRSRRKIGRRQPKCPKGNRKARLPTRPRGAYNRYRQTARTRAQPPKRTWRKSMPVTPALRAPRARALPYPSSPISSSPRRRQKSRRTATANGRPCLPMPVLTCTMTTTSSSRKSTTSPRTRRTSTPGSGGPAGAIPASWWTTTRSRRRAWTTTRITCSTRPRATRA